MTETYDSINSNKVYFSSMKTFISAVNIFFYVTLPEVVYLLEFRIMGSFYY